MSTELQTYTQELLYALRLRDVPGPRIAEALAEVGSHVSETGEDPRAAFGPPKEYAEQVLSALGRPGASSSGWTASLSRTALTYGLGAGLGAWLLIDGVLALVDGDRGPLALPALACLLLGLVVLALLGLGLRRLAAQSDDQVLDPRTGDDMTPPLPRWAVLAMACPPVLAVAIAVAVGVASR